MKRLHSVKRMGLLVGLLLLCAALGGCGAKDDAAARVLLDGAVWDGAPVAPGDKAPLRVYITLDGKALIDLPFDTAHTVSVVQPDGGENVVEITGDAVTMRSANCDNQDCVEMGAVTADNLEVRVMGGFIICLPHRLSVEVRGD
ncbi:MAG: NusG domain II-containing protein [Clostridia bacterium]|nr:NusG domain II-containing protein [Clostridia bacterium]